MDQCSSAVTNLKQFTAKAETSQLHCSPINVEIDYRDIPVPGALQHWIFGTLSWNHRDLMPGLWRFDRGINPDDLKLEWAGLLVRDEKA